MVKLKNLPYMADDGTIHLEGWLQHTAILRNAHDLQLIRHACVLSQLAGEDKLTLTNISCLQQGLMMAEILLDLHLDGDTIAAAIVYSSVHYGDLNLDDVRDHLGASVAKLVQGSIQMDAIRSLPSLTSENFAQIENVRKMLLAMAQDMRVVIIKLAERTSIMRTIDLLDAKLRQQISQETMDIYAPLANRLGIGQLKWELEDRCLHFLKPEIYKDIANHLHETLIDREAYIEDIIHKIKTLLQEGGIQNFEVKGRAKHIYSIYRKMQKKKMTIDQLFDLNAVRILVDSVEDCYAALSLLHHLGEGIPSEFDDYIATPKPNGYRSIHTVIVGPKNKNVEIQIRTFEMHQESEHGVAAHWQYKETKQQKSGYQAKIAWLRQVLEWQKELVKTGQKLEQTQEAVLEDRVYVFTPTSEILELPQGATPLDFAYTVHSEVGHRCRGAKINGALVPLTYTLNTGEQVEILTSKQPNPSRDWLNSHLGYLKTSRAKAKVHHWFKLQDYDKNVTDGQNLIERECHRLGFHEIDFEKIAHKIHYKNKKDMFAAVGSGDLRSIQILNAIQSQRESAKKVEEKTVAVRLPSKLTPTGISVEGIGNLLTHTAQCCKPVPGDRIIGFITKGFGVSIHHQDCQNIANINAENQTRLVEVDWGAETKNIYPVELFIEAYDRSGLVRDITTLVANEKLNIVGLNSVTDKTASSAHIHLTIEIQGLSMLNKIIDRIKHIPNIVDVKRELPRKK
jgi:GTP pyrophosphokinase